MSAIFRCFKLSLFEQALLVCREKFEEGRWVEEFANNHPLTECRYYGIARAINARVFVEREEDEGWLFPGGGISRAWWRNEMSRWACSNNDEGIRGGLVGLIWRRLVRKDFTI